MPKLELQDIPEGMLKRLEELASQQRLTTSEEAIRLLERALREEKEKDGGRLAAVEQIWSARLTPPPGTPSVVELVREDRRR
jgi:uncharacterized protein involved in propanediol utilization